MVAYIIINNCHTNHSPNPTLNFRLISPLGFKSNRSLFNIFFTLSQNSDKVISIYSQKSINPRGNQAVVGLYFYPNSVIKVARQIKPSRRGELEITAINNYYLKKGALNLEHLGQGFTWLDTGTHESLLEASQFIETIEKRQGIKVACLEEIAFKKELISKEELLESASQMEYSSYGQYLIKRYST